MNGITLGIVIVIVLMFSAFSLTLLVNTFLAPIIGTPKTIIDKIIDFIDPKPTDTIIDLGSGDGRVIFQIYQRAQCKCIGYDISPLMLIFANTAKILKFPSSKDITFEAQDVFQVDLSKATKVYSYLDEKSLNILKKKFIPFIQAGGQVFSYKYKIPDTKEYKQVILENNCTLYIYKQAA